MIKTGNPAIRLFAIGKRYRLKITLGAFFGFWIATLVGLLTPIKYSSYTSIKVDPQMNTMMLSKIAGFYDPYEEANSALQDAISYMQSNQVLLPVAEKIAALKPDLDYTFPNHIHSTDLKGQLNLLAKRLSNRYTFAAKFKRENFISEDDEAITIASLIRDHIQIGADPQTKTLNLECDAGTSYMAKTLCEYVSEEFISVANVKDLEELKKQESYIQQTIDTQTTSMKIIEGKMEELKREHPEAISGFDQQGVGISQATENFLKTKQEFEKIQEGIKTNRWLTRIYRDIKRSPEFTQQSKATVIAAKLVEEINNLEYQRLTSIKVKGYDPKHPELTKINTRVEKLKMLRDQALAKNFDGSSLAKLSLGPDQLNTEIGKLESELQNMLAKEITIKQSLETQRQQMNDSIRIETMMVSLYRDQQAHLEILKDLRKSLEGVRIQIVSATETAYSLSSPTLPLKPSTIPVPKRAVFGSFVGALLMFCFLFGWDVANPKFYINEDLTSLGLKSFGRFKSNQIEMRNFASCLLTLSESGTKSIMAFSIGPVRSLTILEEISGHLSVLGKRIAIIDIRFDEQDSIRVSSAKHENVLITSIYKDDVPLLFEHQFREALEAYDLVFVSISDHTRIAWLEYISSLVDRRLFFLMEGESEIKMIEHLQTSIASADASSDYAVSLHL